MYKYKKKISINNIFGVLHGYSLKYKTNHVGYLPRIRGRCGFKNKGYCSIGNNVSIRADPYPVSIVIFENAKLIIGDNVYINFGVDIGCTKHIKIGDNVLIGSFVNIIDNAFHYVDIDTPNIGKDVIISDNVWIANHCIILPGVTIGKNSVVAAGSVVTTNIPENVLVAGNPAVVKKVLNIPEGWDRKSNKETLKLEF